MGIPAIVIDVPLDPTDFDQELLSLLIGELQYIGNAELVAAVERQPSFGAAVGLLLGSGVLIAVDEFQRLLDPVTGRPVAPFDTNFDRVARRGGVRGCLWLISNRELDPGWTEPFHTAHLEAPQEFEDQQRIVLQAIEAPDAEEKFPAERRIEVVRRLGANPRVLRLLGHLLRRFSLEELLGPPSDVPEAPIEHHLLDGIERNLLVKASEGLSSDAAELLQSLSVLREPAQLELVQAIGVNLGDVRRPLGELRDRYLLRGHANRYQLHPVIKEVEIHLLRGNAEAWRGVHRRVGLWYAQPLRTVDRTPLGDAEVARRLAGARHHLAAAEATADLREVMRGVSGYIQKRFGWNARKPASDTERDAQISLLELYLEQPGPAGVEFALAKLLKARNAPGDYENALPHARFATEGQDHSHPWVLWGQLVREVEGLDCAIAALREAKLRVHPDKALFSIYQLLGACLDHRGEVEDAIETLLEGAELIKGGNEIRLVAEALSIAAAWPRTDQLQRVRDWASAKSGFDPVVALAEVLLLEHQGEWLLAAEEAERVRSRFPKYLHLAIHETLGWLGAEKPGKAQTVLASLTDIRQKVRAGINWLVSLVALQNGMFRDASTALSVYLGADAPTVEAGIRASLFREWDHRVSTVGEANPALMAPILPPAVTGLDANVYRPQYSPPVLPQHQRGANLQPAHHASLRVLAVATEWSSGHGGLSTFNRQLCCALADAGATVFCLVLDIPSGEMQEKKGVTLVGATHTPGGPEHVALMRKPQLPHDFVPQIIIGHGRVTGPAAKVLADDHFPAAKRLHFVHMAPDEIEWFKLDRGDDSGARAEDRTQVELSLGRDAFRVVAVGPRLFSRYLRDLSPYEVPAPLRLDPGFDLELQEPRTPPPGAPWMILLVGRLEDDNLKGLDIAARAVGLAAERRGAAIPLELVVRGVLPNTSDDLRRKLQEWSGNPALQVLVRPYTADEELLAADLRRASLLLMPSRSEGFGLVGLEAINAGTPALVSGESGLGALLNEALEPEQSSRFVVPMTGDAVQDSEKWGREIEGMLRDRESAFRRADEVRTLLGRQRTWTAAVAGLLAEITDATQG
ncbi:glycosyltransferase family 4 protein [Geomonas ferrireducens]|uniref:glycosyltransferase family 4 protein n=1 Tax=Geomonas ferrireducens TaxID=2570227 RepID=UPI0018E082F2|nr:glycosyltransferase [Geomonas ferrireducens]